MLNVGRDSFEAKYLGLPTPKGYMHKGKFQNLQSCLAKRILLWGDPYQGGRQVLKKLVNQALPTKNMDGFNPPFWLCDDLTRMIGTLGGDQRMGRGKHTGWRGRTCSNPKTQGNMRFKDIRLFNHALLSRQTWRILQFLICCVRMYLRQNTTPMESSPAVGHRRGMQLSMGSSC